MTCGVTMLYYVLHTRPITDGKRVCERCHGAAAPLPAGRAVNELQAAGLRLASARQLVAGLNDKSVTLAVFFACYNKLIRSINNYSERVIDALYVEGVIKGGYPFMFISPFDIKLQKQFK